MTDSEALTLYGRSRDPHAFRHLVDNHQGLVYNAALRILRNAADAEEVAQETFVKLAHHASGIRGNVAGWLHLCSTRLSLNRLRQLGARTQREDAWADGQTCETSEDFRRLTEVLDECLAEMPDSERDLLVRSYFNGETQAEIARVCGISQPAVKQRLDKALENLRKRLHRKGVTLVAAVLAGHLGQAGAQAAEVPLALNASLAKIGVAGLSPAGPSTATIGGLVMGKGAFIAVTSAVVLVAGGLMVWSAGREEDTQEDQVRMMTHEFAKGWNGTGREFYHVSIDETASHGGRASLRVEPPGDPFARAEGNVYQTLRGESFAGKRIRLSAWIRQSGGADDRCMLSLRFRGKDRDLGETGCKVGEVRDAWQLVQVETDVPDGTVLMEAMLSFNSARPLWMDDVQMEVVGDTGNTGASAVPSNGLVASDAENLPGERDDRLEREHQRAATMLVDGGFEGEKTASRMLYVPRYGFDIQFFDRERGARLTNFLPDSALLKAGLDRKAIYVIKKINGEDIQGWTPRGSSNT